MALVAQPKWFKRFLLKIWNVWPPFLGSGITVHILTQDLRQVEVRLKLRFWNKNFFGTQYGGSLFSMTDAMYSVMLIENLGPGYVVWDKSATIRYLKPGRTNVKANFEITQSDIDKITSQLNEVEKMDWHKPVQIYDTHQNLVAEVDKVIYIRRKTTKQK
jgi:hypothetical protein